jgi:DNA-binding CsgD family transcriptional regulator
MIATDPKLLELLGDTVGLLEIDEFRAGLIRALRHAVPADWVTVNDIGPEPASITVLSVPEPDPELVPRFASLAHQNPLIGHYNATHDGRTTRLSDLSTRADFHALEIYQRVYRPMRVEFQLAFTLPHTRDRILGVAMSREHTDFADAEVELIEAARPFLIQAYRNATRFSALLSASVDADGHPPVLSLAALQALGLTRRQAQALALICTGASERDIAGRMGISPRTVQKHLELCYRRLGVSSRSEAAALAWAGRSVLASADA